MIIKSLELANFRNYEELNISFDKGTNILYGDNAQGKTNILEAIYVSATTKSHKGSKDKEIINFDKEEAQTVHPLQVNILGSGDDGEYQSHGVAHHHPVAQGGVLPVIYLHAHIGEHVDKHGTRIADHQQEEEQDAVVDDPELEHLHDEIR